MPHQRKEDKGQENQIGTVGIRLRRSHWYDENVTAALSRASFAITAPTRLPEVAWESRIDSHGEECAILGCLDRELGPIVELFR